jgi:hypothetical protein
LNAGLFITRLYERWDSQHLLRDEISKFHSTFYTEIRINLSPF